MKIFHTSPVEIKAINTLGLFGDCLFFSNDVYTMTASSTVYTYSMEIEDEDFIDVSELYDEEVIKDICETLEVEEDDAERMLDGRDTAFDHGKDGEDDWWIQRIQGECAKKMGYKACKAFDEQGTVYIIPMLGRESELTLEETN
ncbi:hypothetical protein M3I01_013490 [Marinomonas sp. RSW2]|uniref:Uncharacterized protein n=1 Tax=Marinomonas maritima TaxID=2940935 RepID=A0ABT5WGF5_9GAMM|nr:hypothetical protein [Marinomonas maritima]MDE8603911.1 hypothetical protein [Marinomonas maritima]